MIREEFSAKIGDRRVLMTVEYVCFKHGDVVMYSDESEKHFCPFCE